MCEVAQMDSSLRNYDSVIIHSSFAPFSSVEHIFLKNVRNGLLLIHIRKNKYYGSRWLPACNIFQIVFLKQSDKCSFNGE